MLLRVLRVLCALWTLPFLRSVKRLGRLCRLCRLCQLCDFDDFADYDDSEVDSDDFEVRKRLILMILRSKVDSDDFDDSAGGGRTIITSRTTRADRFLCERAFVRADGDADVAGSRSEDQLKQIQFLISHSNSFN